MKSPVRPELPTASVGSSQAPTAAVDNSAPLATRTESSTYKSGNAVQTSGATSTSFALMAAMPLLIIPFERTNVNKQGRAKSAISDVAHDRAFFSEFSELREKPFQSTFVPEPRQLELWRFVEIFSNEIDKTRAWRDSLARIFHESLDEGELRGN